MAELITARTANPFQRNGNGVAMVDGGAMAEVEQQRSIAEVQAALTMAKRFPRDQIAAMDRILQACTRPSLANGALYSYNRGGTDVTGPSIRLAEAIAQAWGNIEFGIRELSQRPGVSSMQAFAWDMETNTRQTKVFEVPHIRHTKQGVKQLTDPRDIYEMTANQGARRLRACILGIIPGDVIESAVEQCDKTLKTSADTSPAAIKKMAEVFAEYGVTPEQIQKRIGMRLEAIRPAQMIQMRKIYTSLKDGMSVPEDWFEASPVDAVVVPDTQQAAEPDKPKVANGKAKAAPPVPSIAADVPDIGDIPDVTADPEMTAEAMAIKALGNARSAGDLDNIMAGLDDTVARLPNVLSTFKDLEELFK